jgi:hydrogenase maturation factor
MKAVTIDPVLLELAEAMEVRMNIKEEARREKALYERGVRAMREAMGIEASDYAPQPVVEIVIDRVQVAR